MCSVSHMSIFIFYLGVLAVDIEEAGEKILCHFSF